MSHAARAAACAALLCSLTTAATAQVVLQPGPAEGKDANVGDAAFIADQNQGEDSFLISPWSNGTRWGGFIQFDLDFIPPGTPITGAVLELFHAANPAQGDVITLHRVLAPWDELLVTWNNQPAYDPAPLASLVVPDNDSEVWRGFVVQTQVQAWIDGTQPNYGFFIEAVPSLTGTGDVGFFASSDALEARRPRLILDADPGLIPDPSADIPLPAPLALLAGALALTAGLRRRG